MQRAILIQLFILMGIASTPKAGAAAPAMLSDDPKRPVDQISSDLAIPASIFKACFSKVQPSSQGNRPTRERVHANKAVLLACLQQSNPKITNQSLDTVMDRYRPVGKEAQERPR